MKKNDLSISVITLVIISSFFVFPSFRNTYHELNAHFPYYASFVKFAILATFGECLGLRIRTGQYWKEGFGIIPRAFVWGFLGITIKMAFVVFGEGAPMMLKTMGVHFPTSNPADILRQHDFSWLKLLSAFSVSTSLNVFFAPVFMTFHRITDMHIAATQGKMKGFLGPIPMARYFEHIDWDSMWNFVFKKTIIFFWIPAQTLNFMLPEDYRILIAAIYSVILGVILSLASMMAKKRM